MDFYTEKENEIILHILEGKCRKEIASALYISENTVKFHISNILRKSGCRTRTEFVARRDDEAAVTFLDTDNS